MRRLSGRARPGQQPVRSRLTSRVANGTTDHERTIRPDSF